MPLGGRARPGWGKTDAHMRLSFNGRMSRQFTDPEVVISEAPLTVAVEGFILAQPSG